MYCDLWPPRLPRESPISVSKFSTKTARAWWCASRRGCRRRPRRASIAWKSRIKAFLQDATGRSARAVSGHSASARPAGLGGDRFRHPPPRAHKLAQQFEHRTVKKLYWACVEGRPDPPAGTWRDYLARSTASRRPKSCRPNIPRPAGRAPLSDPRRRPSGALAGDPIGDRPDAPDPHPSRRRAAIRCLGDFQYGAKTPFGPQYDDERLRAIALHARTLEFEHPTTKQRVSVIAPTPEFWPTCQAACGFACFASIREIASGRIAKPQAEESSAQEPHGHRPPSDLDRLRILAPERSAGEHVEDDRLRCDCGTGKLHYGRKKVQPSAREIRGVPRASAGGVEVSAAGFSIAGFPGRRRCVGRGDPRAQLYLLCLRDHARSRAYLDPQAQTSSRRDARKLPDRQPLAASQRGTASDDHPVWGGPGWKVFLDTPTDIRRTIRYIDENPAKWRLPRQCGRL